MALRDVTGIEETGDLVEVAKLLGRVYADMDSIRHDLENVTLTELKEEIELLRVISWTVGPGCKRFKALVTERKPEGESSGEQDAVKKAM